MASSDSVLLSRLYTRVANIPSLRFGTTTVEAVSGDYILTFSGTPFAIQTFTDGLRMTILSTVNPLVYELRTPASGGEEIIIDYWSTTDITAEPVLSQ